MIDLLERLKSAIRGMFGDGRRDLIADAVQRQLSTMPEPRDHHYRFAHEVLPQRLWDDPHWFLENLYGDQRLGFLLFRWTEAAIGLDDSEFLPPEGKLRCDFFDLSRDLRGAVVTLPGPTGVTEAYMVAIVSRREDSRQADPNAVPPPRYFTLEYGFSHDFETAGTVLCEWTQDAHLNYGIGPAPDPKAFIEAIGALLSKSG